MTKKDRLTWYEHTEHKDYAKWAIALYDDGGRWNNVVL